MSAWFRLQIKGWDKMKSLNSKIAKFQFRCYPSRVLVPSRMKDCQRVANYITRILGIPSRASQIS